MKFEPWEKRLPTIEVAAYDSAKPYDGPGEIVQKKDGAFLQVRGESAGTVNEFGPLQDGDYITIQNRGGRQIVGAQTKTKLEEHYRPVAQEPAVDRGS